MNTNASTRRFPLLFILLVFLLSVPLSLAGGGLEVIPGVPVSSLIVTFCPMIAALILVYWREGTTGAIALLKRALDFNRITAKIWLVPVVLLLPAAFALSYATIRLMGVPIPAPRFPLWMPLAMFVAFLIADLGEELGWMGYAIDPMQQRLNSLLASIVLGLVWAAWHAIPVIQVGRSAEWIGWQCLFWVSSRVLIVWLYNNTGKSVFVAAVFHSISNICSFLFPIDGSFYDPRVTGLIVAGVALVVVFAWGPETLARSRVPSDRTDSPGI